MYLYPPDYACKYVFVFIYSLDVIVIIIKHVSLSLKSYVMDEENVNWDTCILCQEDTGKILKQPSRNNNKNEIKSTWEGVETVLKDYHNASILPKTLYPILPRLISPGNLSTLVQEKEAKWNRSCKGKVKKY